MSRIWPAKPHLRRWRGHREVSWIPKSWTFNNHIEEEIQWKKWPSFSGRSKCPEHWGARGRPANAILVRELSSLTTRKGHIMPLSLPFSRASRQHQHITQGLPSRNDASLCLWTLLSPPWCSSVDHILCNSRGHTSAPKQTVLVKLPWATSGLVSGWHWVEATNFL